MVRRYALIKKGVLIIILATYYEVVVCYHNYIAKFGTVLYHQYFNFTGKCQNGRWMGVNGRNGEPSLSVVEICQNVRPGENFCPLFSHLRKKTFSAVPF